MNKLPERSASTMSDAIALSSPNGRMSKRSKKAADEHLCMALFGVKEVTLQMLKGDAPQPSRKEQLLRRAADLRDLAARGMSKRKFTKAADQLEAEAMSLAE